MQRTRCACIPAACLIKPKQSKRSVTVSRCISTTSHETYKSLSDIPGPRPSLPFVGTAWQYFRGGRYRLSSLHESCLDKYNRYGPVVREEFQWQRPVVHLFRPEDFETVFRCQGSHPQRPISDFLKHYRLSNSHKYDTVGLANSLGGEWKRLRKTLSPVLLQLRSLDGYFEDMNDVCSDFVALLRDMRNPTTDIIDNFQEIAYRLSLEAVHVLSLDSRLGCLKLNLLPNTPEFAMIASVKLLFEAFQSLYYGIPLWKLFPTKSYRKLDKAESIMYEAANDRIQRAIDNVKQNSGSTETRNKPSVLQTLIETKDLTEKEIRVTVLDFFSGGVFTVANAFSFLVYHLSRNATVQEKLYKEVISIAPDCVITSKKLSKMPYLKACVKESFRLTPIIPCVTRMLPEDVTISGYNIPAGTPIHCNFIVPCQQAERFPEPEQFRPERWLNRSAHPFILLPFGIGYRMCVGRRFAEMEMYTALAKLVYNFKLESTGQEVKCKQAFIVVPSHPVSVILKDR